MNIVGSLITYERQNMKSQSLHHCPYLGNPVSQEEKTVTITVQKKDEKIVGLILNLPQPLIAVSPPPCPYFFFQTNSGVVTVHFRLASPRSKGGKDEQTCHPDCFVRTRLNQQPLCEGIQEPRFSAFLGYRAGKLIYHRILPTQQQDKLSKTLEHPFREVPLFPLIHWW